MPFLLENVVVRLGELVSMKLFKYLIVLFDLLHLLIELLHLLLWRLSFDELGLVPVSFFSLVA